MARLSAGSDGRRNSFPILPSACLRIALLALIASLLSTCDGGPESTLAPTVVSTPAPTPDIEATVQARLSKERSAEAMAKAMVEATAQAVPTATLIPPSSTPTLIPKISTDSSQSIVNSRSVGIAKSGLDSDGGPEQPTSQPSRPLPEKPKYPRLDSTLNKLVGQIGSRSTADIANSVPVSIGDPEQPTSQPPRSPLNKPKYPLLDSTLNKLVGQIGSRSTADIASSAPVSIGDLVAVTVRLSHKSSSTVDFLESVGAIVANIGTDYIEAYTPVTFLVPLSERDGVLRVEAIIPSEPAVTDN